ncbi:M48 family metallopeptidase [Sphaerisporangium sp. TRM90804]|uniref:M48 family metallopeptidase n=1 Tax=Sphaerisporangium sp. TRM90804 TaxID=3031113 RepID=UPI002449B7D0|nr:M48 family metallopeptidase [Sphaerisporangium sp. TRM90804]MDH2424554.1 M48 family metallopeptidase [Sphaerisporangium sp. TRM90804]
MEDTRRHGVGGAGARAAGVGLLVLGGALVVVAALTTPWRSLPGGAPAVVPDPARDFTAAQIARAEAFDAAVSLPSYLSLAVTLVVAGVLVLTPAGAWAASRLKGPWWLRTLLAVPLISAVSLLLKWPLGMWFEARLREYGLSTQGWPAWSADRLKSFAVQTVLITIMVLAVVWLARRAPRRWWIPAAGGAAALTVVASFVYPLVVEPLFNDFTPLPAGPLRSELIAMAARDGVPVEDVLVADASRRTTALNAYVSGFGATRRIVVYDTLLRAPAGEVKLVVAHELGHADEGDVLYGTLVGALGAAAGACLLFLVLSCGRLRRRTGVASVGDPRAAGLLLGLMSIATVLSGPAENLVSRHIEARADVHALDLTRDPATFAAMQKRLAVTNISDLSPSAFEYLMYASHPTSPQRLALARSWARVNGLPEP